MRFTVCRLTLPARVTLPNAISMNSKNGSRRKSVHSPARAARRAWIAGLTGYLHFRDADKKPQFAVISVKGGGIKSGDVRDLKGTMGPGESGAWTLPDA